TDEEKGEVFASSLVYSGSHYESAEVDEAGRTRLSAGINPESFAWKLAPGESFETPEAALCYSDGGLGGMTRAFHDFWRKYMIDPKWVSKRRPVVLNSWEGMHFSFDRDRLFATIDALNGSGIELFVLDDGWFGARNNDRAGLGDWFVNEEKLPGGLRAIADRCRENGIEFGLWIEPEMVNPDSDLYRAHPDWAISVPGREPVTSRNQLVLDFSRDDVVDYISALMKKVIAESGASYIKWDMNRPLTENWSAALPADRQGEVQHRFVLGMYRLARELTGAFPDVLFEGCSGGGGRFDGAMLAFFPQIWSSDNTDADDRSVIQYGTGLVFPLSASSNHVSLSPNIRNGRIIPARTRTDVAYLGTFGYEFDVRKYPADEFASIAADVERYKKIAPLVLDGDLYRDGNRFDRNEYVVTLVSKDKKNAYVTYYQALNPHKQNPKFRIPGLDPGLLYRIEELDLTLPGSVLANLGLCIPRFKGDFRTATFTLAAV
ncbi:MAG: alpha-galactosidase, partial [Clostridia bacterium]|nr:alpha-galactosidase [Clostridia bacterium]